MLNPIDQSSYQFTIKKSVLQQNGCLVLDSGPFRVKFTHFPANSHPTMSLLFQELKNGKLYFLEVDMLCEDDKFLLLLSIGNQILMVPKLRLLVFSHSIYKLGMTCTFVYKCSDMGPFWTVECFARNIAKKTLLSLIIH